MLSLYVVSLCFLILVGHCFVPLDGADSYLGQSNLPAPHVVHIGLIVEKKDKNQRNDLYPDVTHLAREHIRDQKNILLRWTVIEIINRTISNSPRDAVQKTCELLQRGVSAIIFPGPSNLVKTVADIANSYNISVITPTATDPFLINPTYRPFLLQMPPTDTHQSEAIAAILEEYGWIYFSILTSLDSYGINGMLKLQQIASDKKWKIHNTQHFVVPKNINELNVEMELDVIKKSEARIIVLNCQASAANRVLNAAMNKGMVGEGYMWIVTDGVVGNQDELTNKMTIHKMWNGILGTLPSYKNEDPDPHLDKYRMFKKSYEERFINSGRLKRYDLNKNPFAAMVYDSVFIFAHALHNYLNEGHELREVKIVCINKKCEDAPDLKGKPDAPEVIQAWEHGEMFFRFLTNVNFNGASRNYSFDTTGISRNPKYSIMNFKNDKEFYEVGEYEINNQSTVNKPSIKWNGEKVIFMGTPDQKPEYQPITLKGRMLRLGINMEFPFISELNVTCETWNCSKRTVDFVSGKILDDATNCTETEYAKCEMDGCGHHRRTCEVKDEDYVLTCEGFYCRQCNNSDDCKDCFGGPGTEDTCSTCEGNSCYNGYCIDLVKKLSEKLEFNYTFVIPVDGKWGGYSPNSTTGWDGLVHDLLVGHIDIAAVHFSINAAREKSIDFSVPFMQVGLAVVVKAEVDGSNEFFFLEPFVPDVWYCVILSAFLITIIVCVYNKVSPYGLYGRKMHALMTCPCPLCQKSRELAKEGRRSLIKHQEYACLVEEVENYGEDRLEYLNMSNSAWLVIASLLQQGPVEGAPYCLSGRTILSVWWFFMMILIAMYTANLAAWLTVTRMKVGIKSVDDLLSQSKVGWGTVASTSPETLLMGSNKEEYQQLAKNLDNVEDANEGFRRVLEGDYAFIYESALLEFMVQRKCHLVIAGEKFSKFGFAFGFPPNSPYLDLFNNVILKFRESNDLDTAWEKILSDSSASAASSISACRGSKNKEMSQATSQLDMNSLSGLFTVIGLGIVTSFLFLVAEYTFACFEDVYGNEFPDQNERPKNIQQALRRRIKLTWQDISSHWFIFESFRQLRIDSEGDLDKYQVEELTDYSAETPTGGAGGWGNLHQLRAEGPNRF